MARRRGLQYEWQIFAGKVGDAISWGGHPTRSREIFAGPNAHLAEISECRVVRGTFVLPFSRMVGRIVLRGSEVPFLGWSAELCYAGPRYLFLGWSAELCYTGPRYLFLGWSAELCY